MKCLTSPGAVTLFNHPTFVPSFFYTTLKRLPVVQPIGASNSPQPILHGAFSGTSPPFVSSLILSLVTRCLQNKVLTVVNAIILSIRSGRMISRAYQPHASLLMRYSERIGRRAVHTYKYGLEEAQVWGIGHCHIGTAWYVCAF